MKRTWFKNLMIFLLGMLTLAIGAVLFTVFGFGRRPSPAGSVENRGEICFQPGDTGHMLVRVNPEGCFSPNCSRPTLLEGTAILDRDRWELRFDTHFVIAETSRFPFPCSEDCTGGHTIHFDLGVLDVGDYAVWVGDERVGDLMVFSGLPTPDQCFQTQPR